MATLKRNYQTEKHCRACYAVFIPETNGPQQYCTSCKTTCSVQGCARPTRAKGKCDEHLRLRFPVEVIPEGRDGTCGIPGCDRPVMAKGHCNMHYQRVNLTGSVGDVQPRQRRVVGVRCSVEGCHKAAQGGGLCITHYQRKRKFGDPGGAKLLRAAQGEGSIKPNGYRIIVVGGKHVYEHRHVMEQKLGRKLRRGENAHHMDGDKLNNDPTNLELWSRHQPSGQRVADKVAAAIKMLREHPDVAREAGVRLLDLESQAACDYYGVTLTAEDVSAYLAGALAC